MSAAPLIPVRLTANYRVYNAGEVAGFPSAEAADLIERGLGEPYGATAASDDSDESQPVAEAKGGKKK